MKKYIVRDGDTMWKISKETDVKLNLLMAANPQVTDPNQLRPGSVLVVPELNKPVEQAFPQMDSAPQQTKPGSTPSPPSQGNMSAQVLPSYFGFVWPHVVQQGETWESIAKRYHVEMPALRQMNASFRGRPLKAGEMVYVPAMTSQSQSQAQAKSPHDGVKSGASMPKGMPDTMSPGAAVMPPGYPAQGMPSADPGQGPHTHYPYRAEQPLPPMYGLPGPLPPMHYMPVPHPSHFMSAHPHMTSVWYDEWDESSSWESSWESGSSSTMRTEYRTVDDRQRPKETDDDDSYVQ